MIIFCPDCGDIHSAEFNGGFFECPTCGFGITQSETKTLEDGKEIQKRMAPPPDVANRQKKTRNTTANTGLPKNAGGVEKIEGMGIVVDWGLGN